MFLLVFFIKSCLPKICLFHLYWSLFRLDPQLFLYISSNSISFNRKKSDVKCCFAFRITADETHQSLLAFNLNTLYRYTHVPVACISASVAQGYPIHFDVFPCTVYQFRTETARVFYLYPKFRIVQIHRVFEGKRPPASRRAQIQRKYKGVTVFRSITMTQILGFCLKFHLPEPSILHSNNWQPLYSLQSLLLPSDQIKNMCLCQIFQSSLRTSGHYAHQSSSGLCWIPVGLDPMLAGWWKLR